MNLSPVQTQQLETIIKNIQDTNMAGSSLHKNPADIQLGKLIALTRTVTLTPNTSNTIPAQKIKEIYWALETLVKMSSSVKQVISSQYNKQDSILDGDPEAGAGMGANRSYQNG